MIKDLDESEADETLAIIDELLEYYKVVDLSAPQLKKVPFTAQQIADFKNAISIFIQNPKYSFENKEDVILDLVLLYSRRLDKNLGIILRETLTKDNVFFKDILCQKIAIEPYLFSSKHVTPGRMIITNIIQSINILSKEERQYQIDNDFCGAIEVLNYFVSIGAYSNFSDHLFLPFHEVMYHERLSKSNSNLVVKVLEFLTKNNIDGYDFTNKSGESFVHVFLKYFDKFDDPIKILSYLLTNFNKIAHQKNIITGDALLHMIIKHNWNNGLQYLIDNKYITVSDLYEINNAGLSPIALICNGSDMQKIIDNSMQRIIEDNMQRVIASQIEQNYDYSSLLTHDLSKGELKEMFAYLNVTFSNKIFMQELKNIKDDITSKFEYNDFVLEVKDFITREEMQNFLKVNRPNATFYFTVKYSPLRLYVFKSQRFANALTTIQKKRERFNTTKINQVSNSVRLTEHNIPKNMEDFIKLMQASDFTENSYRLLVHVFATDPDSLSNLLRIRQLGGQGFIDTTASLCVSLIDNGTPMAAHMSYHMLPTMALIIEQPYILYAAAQDAFTNLSGETYPDFLIESMMEFTRDIEIYAAVKNHVAKNIQAKDMTIFEQQWLKIILLFSQGNELGFNLNSFIAGHGIMEQDILTANELLNQTKNGNYNEVLILGSNMNVDENKTTFSGIAIEYDDLEALLLSLNNAPTKVKVKLIEYFNMILELNLPIVVIKTDSLRSAAKFNSKYRDSEPEKLKEKLADINKKIEIASKGIYWLNKSPSTTRNLSESKSKLENVIRDNQEIIDYVIKRTKAKL